MLLRLLSGLIPMLTMVNAYQKFYIEELNCTKESTPFEIHLNRSGLTAAAILRASPRGGFPHDHNCHVRIGASENLGIILRIKFVTLKSKDDAECMSKIQIKYTENKKPVETTFCDDKKVFYSTDPGTHFDFTFIPAHEKTNASNRFNFDLTFTAYHLGDCEENYYTCPSMKCIWTRFECDVRDNCDSEESDYFCGQDELDKTKMITQSIVFTSIAIIAFGFLYCCVRMWMHCCQAVKKKNRKKATAPASESDTSVTKPLTTPMTSPKGSELKFHQHDTRFS